MSKFCKKNEGIIWAEGVNKKAYIIKNIFKYIMMFAFLGMFIGMFTTMIISFINEEVGSSPKNFMNNSLIIWGIALIVGVFLSIILSALEANNTFFAITNKRIIKRSGIFNINYIHYSLKNIGTVNVQGGLFDSRWSNGSATLIITVKDFHTNTDGNIRPMTLSIESLESAYKAYNLLSELVDGNNESFMVKLEK